jgi:hypothetical protein
MLPSQRSSTIRIPCNDKASRTIRSAKWIGGYNAGRLLLLVDGSVDSACVLAIADFRINPARAGMQTHMDFF